MALRDPVAVYNAASNVEAHLIRNALLSQGIEAHVTEDVSQVGTWALGLIPELHKPQVWVERSDIDSAKPVLDDFERRAADLRDAKEDSDTLGETPVEVICDECGRPSTFPAAQRGSVQQCAHCRAFVDVGIDEFSEEWAESPADDEEAE